MSTEGRARKRQAGKLRRRSRPETTPQRSPGRRLRPLASALTMRPRQVFASWIGAWPHVAQAAPAPIEASPPVERERDPGKTTRIATAALASRWSRPAALAQRVPLPEPLLRKVGLQQRAADAGSGARVDENGPNQRSHLASSFTGLGVSEGPTPRHGGATTESPRAPRSVLLVPAPGRRRNRGWARPAGAAARQSPWPRRMIHDGDSRRNPGSPTGRAAFKR